MRFRRLRSRLILDLARHAALRQARHQHEAAARQRHVGRQRRALAADALLGDLHDDLLPLARLGTFVAGDARAALDDVVEDELRPRIGRQDVRGVEEAVGPAAERDECRADRRLDVDDPALVDVAEVGLAAGDLDVKFSQDAILHHRDPGFLRIGGVDQHSLQWCALCVGRGRSSPRLDPTPRERGGRRGWRHMRRSIGRGRHTGHSTAPRAERATRLPQRRPGPGIADEGPRGSRRADGGTAGCDPRSIRTSAAHPSDGAHRRVRTPWSPTKAAPRPSGRARDHSPLLSYESRRSQPA
jgi:hypothetical protein